MTKFNGIVYAEIFQGINHDKVQGNSEREEKEFDITHQKRPHARSRGYRHTTEGERDLVLVLLEETHILLRPEEIETTGEETDMSSVSSNINQNTESLKIAYLQST